MQKNTFLPRSANGTHRTDKLASVGDELEILSTDKGSASDIPEWINKVGHELLDSFEEDGVLHLVVKKTK